MRLGRNGHRRARHSRSQSPRPPANTPTPAHQTPPRLRLGGVVLGRTHSYAVAVGTALSGGPPHRSQRAELPHWAPALGCDAQTLLRIEVRDLRSGQPFLGKLRHSFPSESIALTATPKRPEPHTGHLVMELVELSPVARHAVVSIVTPKNRGQPSTDFTDSVVHAPLEQNTKCLELRAHTFRHRRPNHLKRSFPRPPTNVGESQKVEGLRLSLSTILPSFGGVPSELEKARLVGMKFQLKLSESLPKLNEKLVRFLAMFESNDEVIGITNDDHLACRLPTFVHRRRLPFGFTARTQGHRPSAKCGISRFPFEVRTSAHRVFDRAEPMTTSR